MRRSVSILILLSGWFPTVLSAVIVDNSRMWPRPVQGDIIYAGDISLPSGERWRVLPTPERTRSESFYLIGKRSGNASKSSIGRLGSLEAKRMARRGEALLRTFYRALRDHALQHGRAPQGLNDLEATQSKRLQAFNDNAWNREDSRGPYAFLLPGVDFSFGTDSKQVDAAKRQLLMVELQPYIADGKHWRLYTDGSCLREAIDPALLERYRLTIKPVIGETASGALPETKSIPYSILSRQPAAPLAPLDITLVNETGDKSLALSWDTTQAVSDAGVLEEMQQARLNIWRGYAAANPENLALKAWLESLDKTGGTTRPGRGAGNHATTSLFNLLGGRAAVQETLQLQELQLGGTTDSPADIDINTLGNVEIASHPFETLLKNTAGEQSLPLAEIVPRDRFFLYAKPGALLSLLDRGSEFIHDLDSLISRRALEYDLKKKYLLRLGLSEIWLSTFLQAGIITEAALVAPDLFFIDGTELTVAVRLADPHLLPPLLLRGIGLPTLAEGSIITQRLADDGQVFWALAEDILICSTSRQEIAALLDLQAKTGQGSLGKSAEFRYMLEKLPPDESTQLYAYLSDPFIRRLVAAKTKIGQLRRLQARRDLEKLTGSALLAKLDGMDKPNSLQQLIAHGYAPASMARKDYSLAEDLTAHSTRYGSLGGLTPVSRLDIRTVTPQEAEAYRGYLDNYSRFWSRYFDPIAMRVNDRPDGSHEATTFILPLIENSIYDAVRNLLASAAEGHPLSIPVLDPKPLSMLSFNLNEEGVLNGIKLFHDMLGNHFYIHPAFFDDLGPAIHLAVHDADPVISLGSADLLGIFNDSRLLNSRRPNTFLIPAALTMLTRPCTLYIETQSPAKTRAFLQHAVFLRNFRRDGINGEFYQVGDGDNWITSFDILGLIRLRFGLGIEGDFLTVKNIPWGDQERVTTTAEAGLNGASLQLAPNAVFKQLPALFNTAQEQERKTAIQGLSYLYPILASGYADIGEASRAHNKLFGFTPIHPANGEWLWDGKRIASSRYGTLSKQQQPAYEEGMDDFGLFRDIDHIDLNMQLEAEGLRASVVWQLRPGRDASP